MPERGDKTDDELIFENIPVQVNTKAGRISFHTKSQNSRMRADIYC